MSVSSANTKKILADFDRRYRNKKLLNLIVSFAIIIMGITSFIYIWNVDKEGILTFRWMTVDGTLFTVAMTIFYAVVNIIEIRHKTELTRKAAYFARLSSSVAECTIIIVVLLSQLPIFEQHMHIFRYDMYCMHIMIPLLTVVSFVMNDSPIEKLKIWQIPLGSLFVFIYASIIITLITTGIITKEQIPYFFLDFESNGTLFTIFGFIFIFGMEFALSCLLSYLNRKLYWLWFKKLGSTRS